MLNSQINDKPLSFEEWKRKHNISITNVFLEDIATETDSLNEFLEKCCELYSYQADNPSWYDALKDINSSIRIIRNDWETIVDAATIAGETSQ